MRFLLVGLVLSVLVLSPELTLGALDIPNPIYPTQKDSPVWKGRVNFSWTSTKAPFYTYSIDNLTTGAQKNQTVLSTSDTRYGLETGNYRWRVSSCNNKEGTGCGEWSETQTFKIVPAPPGATGGLIPCGRQYDDTIATPYIDESKPCGIPHLVLLLKNLLDFVLWRLGLLVIAVMAVVTGAITYFSFGSPNIILQVKSIWKSVLVGYLIALFAWFAVNVLLNILGFKVQLFGTWWQLPL